MLPFCNTAERGREVGFRHPFPSPRKAISCCTSSVPSSTTSARAATACSLTHVNTYQLGNRGRTQSQTPLRGARASRLRHLVAATRRQWNRSALRKSPQRRTRVKKYYKIQNVSVYAACSPYKSVGTDIPSGRLRRKQPHSVMHILATRESSIAIPTCSRIPPREITSPFASGTRHALCTISGAVDLESLVVPSSRAGSVSNLPSPYPRGWDLVTLPPCVALFCSFNRLNGTFYDAAAHGLALVFPALHHHAASCVSRVFLRVKRLALYPT